MHRLENAYSFDGRENWKAKNASESFLYDYDTLGILQRRTVRNALLNKHYEINQQHGNVVVVDRLFDEDKEGICHNYNPTRLNQWKSELHSVCLPVENGETIREYDEAGNLISFTNTETGNECYLTWNSWNELVQVEVPNQYTWKATYDARGED